MNTLATIDPFIVAMMSATVIASGTARCTWLTATVIAGEHEQRRADHQVGADALLIASGSECMRLSTAA